MAPQFTETSGNFGVAFADASRSAGNAGNCERHYKGIAEDLCWWH